MHRLVPSRFQVEQTLLELDEHGEPVNEHAQQPIVLYGLSAMRAWIDELPARVVKAEEQLETNSNEGGASDGRNNEIRAAVSRADRPA